MAYLKNFTTKLKESFTMLVVIMLVFSMTFGSVLTSEVCELISDSLEVAFAEAGGGSGGTSSGTTKDNAQGGIYCMYSGFKIGIINDTKYQYKPLEESLDELIQRVGYVVEPSEYIYLIPSVFNKDTGGTRAWGNDLRAAYYDTSERSVNIFSKDASKKYIVKCRNNMTASFSNPEKVAYYDDIWTAISTDDKKSVDTTKLEAFNSGGWKDILNKNYSSASLDAWEYITGFKSPSNRTYEVSTRYNKIFATVDGKTITSESYNTNKSDATWVAKGFAEAMNALFTLYTITPESNTGMRNEILDAIEDYIETNNEKGYIITIEPAVSMACSQVYWMSSTDWLNYYLSMSNSTALGGKALNTELANKTSMLLDGYKQMEYAFSKEYNAFPKVSRMSSKGYNTNAYTWCRSAITNKVLTSKYNSGTLVWITTYQTFHIHENLWLNTDSTPKTSQLDTHYGFAFGENLVVFSLVNVPTLDGGIGKLVAEPDDYNMGQATTLTKNVDLKIYPNVKTDAGRAEWAKIIAQAKTENQNFELYVKVTRTCDYSFTETNPNYVDTTYATGELNKTFTPEQLEQFILSDQCFSSNVDLVSNYEVPYTEGQEENIKFTYTMDLQLKVMQNGKEVVYKPKTDADKTDTASYKREKLPKQFKKYTSEPEAYAELKNYGAGSNQSGTLSEDYEVLAGVPTTEQLYYAVGGSEFIVDIQLEYMTDQTAVRSYISHYKGVDCQFKTGDAATETWTVPAYSGPCGSGSDCTINIHNGDLQLSCTISGSIGNDASAVTANGVGSCSATCVAIPNAGDLADRAAAYAALTTWYNSALAYEIQHTSASEPSAGLDGLRKTTVQGVTSSSSLPGCPSNVPQNTSASASAYHTETVGSGSTQTTITVPDPCSCTASPSGPASWSVTATITVKQHSICGPCCCHELPDIYDTWSQSFTYDCLNIADVHVWRIDQGAVSGLEEVIGPAIAPDATYTAGVVSGTFGPYNNKNGYDDGIVGASIKTNAPNIFYNIAMKESNDITGHSKTLTYLNTDGIGGSTESSFVNRVRYNLAGNWTDAKEHDIVVYELGARTNTCDGKAKTYDTNIRAAGGNGHGDKWGKGFLYSSFANTATVKGMNSSTAVNSAKLQGTAAANAGTARNYYAPTKWNVAGQTNFPLNVMGYLQAHCDGKDSDYVKFFGGSTDTTSNEGRLDVNTPEYKALNAKRQQTMQVTLINDFLILQTTSGDQSVMQYEVTSNTSGQTSSRSGESTTYIDETINRTTGVIKAASGGKSYTVTAETKIPTKHIYDKTLWENNTNSASQWDKDEINVGGYNGNYSSPTTKFKGTGNGAKINSVLGGNSKDPAGKVTRPTRPGQKLMIYSNPINIITTLANESYCLNSLESEVFWTNNLHWSDLTADSGNAFSANPTDSANYTWNEHIGDTDNYDFSKLKSFITTWGQNNNDSTHSYLGYILDTKYSDQHDIECNGLIIQDPISATEACVESLDSSRDQRYGVVIDADYINNIYDSDIKCPGTAAECEFAVLNCHYGEDETLGEFYFNDGTLTNSVNKISLGKLPSGWNISNGKLVAGSGATRIPIAMVDQFGQSFNQGIKFKITADVTISQLPKYTDSTLGGALKTRVSQMLFSYENIGLYISTDGKIGFIDGDGQYRESKNITVSAGKTYSIEVVLSMYSIDRCTVKVNGTTATFTSSTTSTSKLKSSDVGEYLYIGAMKAYDYGPRCTYDNVKISRVAGTYSHTDECYVTQMMHPNGNNAHIHTKECLGDDENYIKGLDITTVDGVKYAKVFDQNSALVGYFTSESQASYNLTPGLFSVLNYLDQIKADGKYQFMLYYPDSGIKIIWKQSNNPMTDNDGNYGTDGSKVVKGYESVSVPYESKHYYWGGLVKSSSGACLLDGSVGHSNWHYAVGSYTSWPIAGYMPSGESAGTRHAQLWIVCNDEAIKYGNTYTLYTESSSTGGSTTYSYTGNYQTVTLNPGTYKLEAWGAAGGNGGGSQSLNGWGGYTSGTLTLTAKTNLYVYVGQQGGYGSGSNSYGGPTSSFNGGGAGGNSGSGAGGGATDFRITAGTWNNAASLKSRILVAGGGGGSDNTGGSMTQLTASNAHSCMTGVSISGGTITIGPSQHKSIDFTSVLTRHTRYTVEFTASSTVAGDILHVDAYPDTLPQIDITLTTTPTTYRWDLDMSSTWTNPTALRFFSSGETTSGTMTITNVKIGTRTSDDDGSGGNGGGLTSQNPTIDGTLQSGYQATQTSGYQFGIGQSVNTSTDSGGGGGGYWGGKATQHYNGGAAGGSSYVSGYTGCDTTYKSYQGGVSFTDVSILQGVNSGSGYARITTINSYNGKIDPVNVSIVQGNEGYNQVKADYEAGKLTISDLKTIFGDAYEALFESHRAILTLSSFSSASQFKNAYNCELAAYSGNLVQSIVGTAPTFTYSCSVAASSVESIDIKLTNNTSATKAKIYWSNDGSTYTEAKSMTLAMEANKANQILKFPVGADSNWSGTIKSIKFAIPAETDKNYGNSISYNYIIFRAGANATATYSYTGGVQSYTANVTGYYLLEAWGAQGGTNSSSDSNKGGYTSGVMKLSAGQTIYTYVGGQGSYASSTGAGGGYNGGGAGTATAYGGGGMTHFSTVSTDKFSNVVTSKTVNTVSISKGATVAEFNYTGSVQQVNLQPGKYTIEIYGAQGQSAAGTGGYGGYSKGTYTVTAATTLYFCVGGTGNKTTAGYNGGGTTAAYGGAGGGATSVTTSNRGTLNNFASYKDEVLLVAGGGGGDGGRSGRNGGAGGGANQSGTNGYNGCGGMGYGASTTAAGSSGRNGSAAGFGYGGNQTAGSGNGGAGGGGGYYGGGAGGNDYSSFRDNDDSGGGGGSGYANTSKLTNVSGSTGVRTGNGYAKVTADEAITVTTTTFNDSSTANFSAANAIIVAGGGGGKSTAATLEYDFSYTGSVQSVTLPAGTYKLETWGAAGGGNDPTSTSTGSRGGAGGYTSGIVTFTKQTTLYIYVGGAGKTVTTWTDGGYNGGGGACYTGNALGTGGGATDIRITGGVWNNSDSLKSRIIVAGGGGGSDDTGTASGTYNGSNDESGGAGGGLTGGAPKTSGSTATYGYGTQSAGGTAQSGGVSGGFGYGGGTTNSGDYGGGGGGYYGGASGGGSYQGGGGGSSYVSGYTGCDTTYRSYQGGYTFTDVVMQQGVNTGNGKAKITSVAKGTTTTNTSSSVNYNYGNGGYQGSWSSYKSGDGEYTRLYSGSNTINLTSSTNSSSLQPITANSSTTYNVTMYFQAGCLTCTMNYTNFKICINGTYYYLDQAKSNGFITDVNVVSTGNTYGNYNVASLASSGTATGGTWASWYTTFKLVNGTLSALQVTSSTNSRPGDGCRIYATKTTTTTTYSGGGSIASIGGYGGGTTGGNASVSGATQSAGNKQGLGQSAQRLGAAGAGGGWYGGLSGWGGGSGGSGYINTTYIKNVTLQNGTTYNYSTSGNNRAGNGMARVTFLEETIGSFPTMEEIYAVIDLLPDDTRILSCTGELNTHVCDADCHEEKVLVCNEPHHSNNHYEGDELCYDACNDDAKHQPKESTDLGGNTPGDFINLDWGFKVYFANKGDFYQSNVHGIGTATLKRGIGYTNAEDTSTWTGVKQVRFPANVIYQGNLYPAGEWVTLSDKGEYLGEDGSPYNEKNWEFYGQEYYLSTYGNEIDGARNYEYEFYCVLDNNEVAAGDVVFRTLAINNDEYRSDAGDIEKYPTYITNRLREGNHYASKHTALNTTSIDVVGRIGNLAIIDTGDYRYSNFFKCSITTTPTSTTETVLSAATNGIKAYNGSYKSNSNIVMDTAGQGAQASNIALEAGNYVVTVKGNNVSNVGLNVAVRAQTKQIVDLNDESGVSNSKVSHVYASDAMGDLTDYIYTISTTQFTLNEGKNTIRVYGTNLSEPSWTLSNNGTPLDTYVTHSEYSDDMLTYEITVPTTMNLVTLKTICESTADDMGITQLSVFWLDEDAYTNIGASNGVVTTSASNSEKVFSVTIENDTSVDMTIINSGGTSEVTSIAYKQSSTNSNSWVVDGLVKNVDQSQQNHYVTWNTDIRGVKISKATGYIDTYSTLTWARNAVSVVSLPLDASDNSTKVLKDDQMLIGYDVYASIETMGDYYNNGGGYLQVIPEYYLMNLDTGTMVPADVYIYYSSNYYPVNIWGLVTGEDKYTWGKGGSGYTIESIYNFTINLDWNQEKERRMQSTQEQYMTAVLKTDPTMMYTDDNGSTVYLNVPNGSSYIMGNAQFMQLNGKARTFVGGECTYDEMMNYSYGTEIRTDKFTGGIKTEPGTLFAINSGKNASSITTDSAGIKHNPTNQQIFEARDWWKRVQRWHLTLGLPSSAVALPAGTEPSVDNIDAVKSGNYVIISALDIRALGEVWNLRYITDPGSITVDDKNYTIPKYITLVDPDTGNTVKHQVPTTLAVYATDTPPDNDISIVSNH